MTYVLVHGDRPSAWWAGVVAQLLKFLRRPLEEGRAVVLLVALFFFFYEFFYIAYFKTGGDPAGCRVFCHVFILWLAPSVCL